MPTLVSIFLSPANAVIDSGLTQQYSATAVFDDGSTQDVTSLAAWSSTNTSVATIDSAGLATLLAGGNTTITAIYSAITGSTSLLVRVLTSVSVTPMLLTLALGNMQQYLAIGHYNDGSTQDLSTIVTWISSSLTIATITGLGLATAVNSGTTFISATLNGITGITSLTVVQTSLVTISVRPQNVLSPVGVIISYQAIGTYTDTSELDITTIANWQSSNPAVATIDTDGDVITIGSGVTTISASYISITGSTSLNVTSATIVNVVVSPSQFIIPPAGSVQFSAVATYSDSTVENITNIATWTSSVLSVGNVSNAGLASGIALGQTIITATFGTGSGFAYLSVEPSNISPTLISVSIQPISLNTSIGQNIQYRAIGSFSDFTTQDLTLISMWSVSDNSKAIISATGLLSTLANGVITITALSPSGTSAQAPVMATAALVISSPSTLPLQSRSHLLQKLQNYFDIHDSRPRKGRYVLDAQILNLAATELDLLELRLKRESSAWSLESVPMGIDNKGLYTSSVIPLTVSLTADETTLAAATGFRNNQPTILHPYDDVLPTPKRVELDFDRSALPMVDPVLVTFIGESTSVAREYMTLTQTIGTLPIADKLTLWLDNTGLNGLDVTVLIQGYTYPMASWVDQRELISEVIAMNQEGRYKTKYRWQVIESITVTGLPTDARLRLWALPFNLPGVKDNDRAHTDYAYRDVLFDRYWTVSNEDLLIREVCIIGRDSGFTYIQSYLAPEPIIDIAVEPWTYGAYLVSNNNLYYIDRREPMPSQLATTALTIEPLFGIEVACDDTNTIGSTRQVTLHGVPYIGADNCFQYRYYMKDPSGVYHTITPNGTLAPYTGSSGWRAGTPKDIILPLPLTGTYVFTLECLGNNDIISYDSTPYINLALNPLIVLSLQTLVPQALGITYDSFDRLWIWTGTYAVPIRVHYDAYVLDVSTRSLYLTDSFDSVDVE